MAERVINREVRERFGGTVKRAVLVRPDDEPGQLVVRVFVEAADDEGLAGWQRAHQAGIEEFRRELSLRLPSARLLEFTYDSPGGEPGAAVLKGPRQKRTPVLIQQVERDENGAAAALGRFRADAPGEEVVARTAA